MFIVLLLCFLVFNSAQVTAEPVTLDLQNNTPLFDGDDCRVYEGKEALRAVYQLVASIRFRAVVVSSVLEEPGFLSLLESKASAGKSIKVYTNTPAPHTTGITYSSLGEDQPSSLIIMTDSNYIGIGNIRLTKSVQRYSSFVVCRDGEAFDRMKDSTKKYTQSKQR